LFLIVMRYIEYETGFAPPFVSPLVKGGTRGKISLVPDGAGSIPPLFPPLLRGVQGENPSRTAVVFFFIDDVPYIWYI
jgi:hypothetical protein